MRRLVEEPAFRRSAGDPAERIRAEVARSTPVDELERMVHEHHDRPDEHGRQERRHPLHVGGPPPRGRRNPELHR